MERRVQRVGDTVRRPAEPWSASVQALLAHVRARGVNWAPEPRGVADGVDMVSFVEGEVFGDVPPSWAWDDAVLTGAVRLLRSFHDATVDFPRAGRTWQLEVREPDEVICHNDAAFYNMVFRGRRPYALIDFEVAAPGPRAWDLAFLAYRLVPLIAAGHDDPVPDLPAPQRARRLGALCDAYGVPAVGPAAVLAAVPPRLQAIATWTRELADRTGIEELREHAARYEEDAAWVGAHAAALTPPATRGPARWRA